MKMNDHYTKMAFQPIEYFLANASKEEIVGAYKLNILKYISRDKGEKLNDLKKARDYLDRWIELEEVNY